MVPISEVSLFKGAVGTGVWNQIMRPYFTGFMRCRCSQVSRIHVYMLWRKGCVLF
jgi:hypothetical protein